MERLAALNLKISSEKDMTEAQANDDPSINRILIGDEALHFLKAVANYTDEQLEDFAAQSQIPAVCIPRHIPTPSRQGVEDDINITLGSTPFISSRSGVAAIQKYVSEKGERERLAREKEAKLPQNKSRKPLSPQSIAPRASTDPVYRTERDKPRVGDKPSADSDAHPTRHQRELAAEEARRNDQAEIAKRKAQDAKRAVIAEKVAALQKSADRAKAVAECAFVGTKNGDFSDGEGTTVRVLPNQNADGTANMTVFNKHTGKKVLLENIQLSQLGKEVFQIAKEKNVPPEVVQQTYVEKKNTYVDIKPRVTEMDRLNRDEQQVKQLMSGGAYLCSLVMNFVFLIRNVLWCIDGEHKVIARKKLWWPICQQIGVIFFNCLLVYVTVKWWWFLWDACADFKRQYYGTEAQRVAHSFQKALTAHVRTHVFDTPPSIFDTIFSTGSVEDVDPILDTLVSG